MPKDTTQPQPTYPAHRTQADWGQLLEPRSGARDRRVQWTPPQWKWGALVAYMHDQGYEHVNEALASLTNIALEVCGYDLVAIRRAYTANEQEAA